jgi:acyl-CoA thioesterase
MPDDLPQPRDPDDVARRSAGVMLDADPASRAAGVRLTDVAPGQATATMTVTAEMANGHGIAHGAYVFLLADTTFAVACNSHGRRTLAAGCDITYLSPAEVGDELVAEAREVALTGRSGLYDVSVRRADGTHVAEMRGRSRTVQGTLVPLGVSGP